MATDGAKGCVSGRTEGAQGDARRSRDAHPGQGSHGDASCLRPGGPVPRASSPSPQGPSHPRDALRRQSWGQRCWPGPLRVPVELSGLAVISGVEVTAPPLLVLAQDSAAGPQLSGSPGGSGRVCKSALPLQMRAEGPQQGLVGEAWSLMKPDQP